MEKVPSGDTATGGAVPYLSGEVPVQNGSVANGAHPEVHEFSKDVAKGEQEHIKCDVLVVGAGFGGITSIHRFRKLGLKVKCFESGGDFGGVWYVKSVDESLL